MAADPVWVHVTNLHTSTSTQLLYHTGRYNCLELESWERVRLAMGVEFGFGFGSIFFMELALLGSAYIDSATKSQFL